jgi:ribosome maturation factor RimP
MKAGESPFFITGQGSRGMKNLSEIRPIIEEKLRFMRLFLHDIRYIRQGKRGILRIFIDKPGGVTIDDCEQASNAISMILDVENFSDQPYSLEVSSPGADRILVSEMDFKMVIGHFLRIEVKDKESPSGEKEIVGKLIASENEKLTLDVDTELPIELPLSEIIKARVDVRFK